MSTKKYKLNIRQGYMAPITLHCSYGDSGETVTFYVFDGSNELDLTNYTATVSGTKIDGSTFGPTSCRISGNSVTFTLTSDITQVEGSATAQITITSGSTIIGTCNFGISVENMDFPYGVSYDSDPAVYHSIVNYIQTESASLSQEISTRTAKDNELTHEIAVERARIDEYLSSGTSASDSELIDIRIGSDGCVYSSAGNSVREQSDDSYTFISSNVFDITDTDCQISGKAVNANGAVYDSDSYTVIKIPVNGIDGHSYYLYSINTNRTGYIVTATRFAMYDENNTKISLLVNNTKDPAIITDSNCRWLYLHCLTSKLTDSMVVKDSEGISLEAFEFVDYYKQRMSKTQWYDKTWSAYGDSITAITNGNYLGKGWAYFVNKAHGFSKFYGRGVGSQSFSWKTGGGNVTFINADGTYNSRNNSYTKDNYTGTIPSDCTAVRGAFCSWDRITAMYPSSIKDTIDVVFIMGGTNDTSYSTELEWIANDATDPEWKTSSYYSTYGGDYNISTLSGGIASTIMKFQAWMPNALIVLGTPLNGNTSTSGAILPATIPDEYEKSLVVEEIAKKFGCPCIDVFGRSGINNLNSSSFITDGTHPYSQNGIKALGAAVAGGFNTIYPRN